MMAESADKEKGGTDFDRQFSQHVLEQMQKRFNISPEWRREMERRIADKVPRPRRAEAEEALPKERLEKENVAFLAAFRLALDAVPKNYFTTPVPPWFPDGPVPEGESLEKTLRELLKQMETRLGETHLGQVYRGVVNGLESKYQQGQVLPVNWPGLRFRLILAALGDLTPRSHLNFFCNFASRVVEDMSQRGFHRLELFHVAELAIRHACTDFDAQRKAMAASRFQGAIHELSDALRGIQDLAQEIMENVSTAMTVQREGETDPLTSTMASVQEKNRQAAETLRDVEEAGIPLPAGLRERMKRMITQARDVGATALGVDKPNEIRIMLGKVKEIRKQSQAMASEFRRIRRKSVILLRRTSARFGRELEGMKPQRVRDLKWEGMLEAAREMIWAVQDAGYALELQDVGHHPGLMRVKAATMDHRTLDDVLGEMERVVQGQERSIARFRHAGRRLLSTAFGILQHVPQAEVDKNDGEGVWATVADLAEAFDRFSMVMEGEERLQLAELPEVLKDLSGALGAADPKRVLAVGVTAALEREKQCQSGELRLSVAQRLDNLQTPLKEMLKVSLDVRSPGSSLWQSQVRAMETLGVTREVEKERGRNYLVEVTVVPLGQMFEPHDPTRGRTRSELERRLQTMPVAGVLPRAILFGARQTHSLEDLGSSDSAREREERVRALVNRSGLIGEVLGLHPLWHKILDSDETRILMEEMRPLFASRAGEGFLSRIVNNNEEYLDCDRVDEGERLEEAGMLRELLIDPLGMEDYSRVLVAGAGLLTLEPLSSAIGKEVHAFLTRQREYFFELGVEDPGEYLRPPEAWDEGLIQQFWGLLDPLSPRKQELCLLQWNHRKLLMGAVLVALLKARPGGMALAETWPMLKQELLDRYQWLVRAGGMPGERVLARARLEELGLTHEVEVLDQGVPELEAVWEKVRRLKMLRSEQELGLGGKVSAMFRSLANVVPRLEAEVRSDFKRLQWLGLKREVRLLERELTRRDGVG